MKNKIIGSILFFLTAFSLITTVLALNIVPIQLKMTNFKLEFGKDEISTNVGDYVIANDDVLQQAQLNLSEVRNTVGKYRASVTYMGETYVFYINIVDTTRPVIKLKQVQTNISTGQELHAIDLLESIEDSSDVIAYFEDEDGQRETSKTFTEKGAYIENIIVVDSSNNQSAKLRVKIVVGEEGDTITMSGVDQAILPVGATFDPLADVKAVDGQGNDISAQISITKNTVDMSKAGTYEIEYTVRNNGIKLQRNRKVVVQE